MAIPDYIPPGKRWDGSKFVDLQADNLEHAQKMILDRDATIDGLTAQVKEWEQKFAEYWSKGIAPIMAAKYAVIEKENAALKAELEAMKSQKPKREKQAKESEAV